MKNPKIIFPLEKDAFYETLKSRVDQYFLSTGKNKFGDRLFLFKAIFLISLYLLFYSFYLFSHSSVVAFISMVVLGPLAILIGINIAHDGAHSSISKNKKTNRFFLGLLDLLGTNSYMWKNRHVFSHHIYPNILNSDADLKQNPLVRIFPNDEIKRQHRYQFIYAPFLYLFYTINWLYFRDFKDFTEDSIGSFQVRKHPRLEIVKLVLFKLFYFSYILIIPLIYSSLTWVEILVGFILMNFAASFLITLALIPSHVAESSYFPLPDENGVMPDSWSHHQVNTIIDFATSNRFLNFFFGGFNHHICHHLFPGICHIHYTKLTPIIKNTAVEFGLKYNYEDSFINAYISHFKLLKNNGVVNE